MPKDPVCGMEIEGASVARTITYQEEPYYFCSPGCFREFMKEPEKYLPIGAKNRKDSGGKSGQTGENKQADQ